jgi:hypothetical protein
MDISTACRILGIDTNASLNDIEIAKRKLLQALHPDKHPSEQKEIFTKMTRDVIEASEFLTKAINLSGGRLGDSADTILEQILFDENTAYMKNKGPTSLSKSLVKYEKRYDSDKVLAVAILSIDYGFTWRTNPNPLFGGGQPQTHSGSALNLVFMNRTDKAISSFYVGYQSFLVDDRGYQYSPSDKSFYWISDNGEFNQHSDFVAPNSKVDGLILFPRLRKDSTKYVRWFLHGSFRVEGEFYDGNYDVRLA